MNPNNITVIVKEGHELTDYDFYILHNTYPYHSDYLDIPNLSFDNNIIYLN